MNIGDALILSLVEGLTEFLPISSTGHLVLASEVLQIQQTNFVKSFEIIIQLGAIFAILFLYWKMLLLNKEIFTKVIVAFLPTAFFGFLLYDVVKSALIGNAFITVFALLIGGIILIILELLYKQKDHHIDRLENISYLNAFFIGLFQSVSMIPGVSRAAATIIGALLLGTKRKTAVEFSFLLAVPTMFAATALDLVKTQFTFSSNELLLLSIGFIGSFITALIAVRFFLKLIQTHTFIPFGIYRIIVALLFFFFVL